MVDTSSFVIPKPIKIYNTLDDYIFVTNKIIISYNKSTHGFKEEKDNYSLPSNSKIYEVYNIIGYIEAEKLGYIICSSQTTIVGKILTSKIFKINKFIYIPSQGNEIREEDEKYIKMIDNFLERNPLYYSDTFDLSISFKKYKNQINNNINSNYSYIFPFSIVSFVWNYSIAKPFDFKGMNNFIYPVINGYFGTIDLSEYSEGLYFYLIARKDNRRSGMRFLIRGGDSIGNVANFVESEEIVLFKENSIQNIVSFEQIRGSIPMLWTQEPNLQLNPLILPVDNYNENYNVFKRHVDNIKNEYGDICIVNLIDQKKDQKTIGDYFTDLWSYYKENNKGKNFNVEYVWFDFHSECKKMKYENLKKLLGRNSVDKNIKSQNFTKIQFELNNLLELNNNFNTNLTQIFHNKNFLNFVSVQNGVFRTNCIDCLDRTNVVQSVFARIYLHKILHNLNLSEDSNGDPFQKFKEVFEKNFKNLWADHGDNISLAYSGTSALKGGFVRTGKRTYNGALIDGYLSCKRFFINNCKDGYNQDCNDYFIGILNPKKNQFKSHNNDNTLKGILFGGIIFGFIVYNILIGFSLPNEYKDNFSKKIYRLIVFSGSMMLTAMTISGIMKKNIIDLHTLHK